MQSKTELEHLLRETVEQVRQDRKTQKQTAKIGGAKFIMNTQVHTADNEDLSDLTQSERERVIELLLSQERVIALLYEKTFPMTSADGQKLNYADGGADHNAQSQMSSKLNLRDADLSDEGQEHDN